MALVIISTSEKNAYFNKDRIAKILGQFCHFVALTLSKNVGIGETENRKLLLEEKTPSSMNSSTNKINSYHISLLILALAWKKQSWVSKLLDWALGYHCLCSSMPILKTKNHFPFRRKPCFEFFSEDKNTPKDLPWVYCGYYSLYNWISSNSHE